jgi:hypothetical protein
LAVTQHFVLILRPEGVEFFLHTNEYATRFYLHKGSFTAIAADEKVYFVASDDESIVRHALPDPPTKDCSPSIK